MSVQSSTQMGTQRTDSFFPTPVAESLLHTEDQMHENMDKARSAFERMKKKATEAQAAKEKENAELRKALALAEAKLKAQEIAFQEKESALIEKNKTRAEENASLKAHIAKCEAFRDQVKGIFTDLRKESWYIKYMAVRIDWYKTGRFPVPWIPIEQGGMVRLVIKAEALGL
jgi:hypothetical protein